MTLWQSPDRILVDGREFAIINIDSAKEAPPAGAIRKPRAYIDRYIELAEDLRPRRAMELGIDSGGSTVFFALLFSQLEQLLALDINDIPIGLADFVRNDPRGKKVACFGGVDQAESETLKSLVDETFEGEPLDLIVDDASHLLPQTRASFETLFPLLRPGGVFVIEDWSWDHQRDRAIARRLAGGDLPSTSIAAVPGGQRAMPLSRLILESVIVAGYAPEVIADVRIRQGWVEIERGQGQLSASEFALSSHLGWIGSGVVGDEFPEI
jgi:predicted O-methyltransferase YrrM